MVKKKKTQTIEKQDNDTMFLWDGVSLFDTEESAIKSERTPIATKDMGSTVKDKEIILKIKKL